MRKIGVYGGTFDPIHHGHLILAREALEALELDEMIFVPAAVSPHKQDRHSTSAEVRLEMLRAAIENEPKFSADDCELRRGAPSYAIETIEALRAREATAQFFYLIGDDNIPGLTSWHRFEELRAMVQFVELTRGDATPSSRNFPGAARAPRLQRRLDISATDIRNRVASGRSIRYLVPEAVDRIIQREQLYRKPTI